MSKESGTKAASTPLDPDRWEKLVALQDAVGRDDFLQELVSLFLRDAALRLSGIREAMVRSDVEAAERSAHSLKGSSSNVGAAQLAALAAEVEKSAGRGDFETVTELLPRLESEVERASQALSEKVARQPRA